MDSEGQYLRIEAEAEGSEKIKIDWMRRLKLVLLCLLLVTSIVAFASSIRLLFILSPQLAVILGLFIFIGISLWNLRNMQEVNQKTWQLLEFSICSK